MTHRDIGIAMMGIGTGLLFGILQDVRGRRIPDPIVSTTGLVLLVAGLLVTLS
ncbi:MAG: hypothetical protein JWO96_144 [Candidatus Saccharibacteria bacterium]|nr:hypothetical protein [Candidatus Saccharibacteria bacterium]